MTSIFIVRAENSGCPDCYIYGVYPTVELAKARVKFLETDTDENDAYECAWYDEVKLGPQGTDCEIA